MKYTIISSSKVKNRSILTLENEYLKRMKSCQIMELPSQKNSDTEGQALLKQASKFGRIISLDESGKQPNSMEFSKLLNSWRVKGISSFAFLIGGAYGLSEIVKSKSDYIWSLSNLTFPFQLARLLTIEQLYRASCIIDGHPYHKEG